jgi:hypothetical protein
MKGHADKSMHDIVAEGFLASESRGLLGRWQRCFQCGLSLVGAARRNASSASRSWVRELTALWYLTWWGFTKASNATVLEPPFEIKHPEPQHGHRRQQRDVVTGAANEFEGGRPTRA